MATAVSVVLPTRAGVAPSVAVAADTVEGNTVPNSDRLHLVLENTDVSPHTVTFTTTVTVGEYAVADHQVTIPAGATRHLANFPRNVFSSNLEFAADDASVMISAYQI